MRKITFIFIFFITFYSFSCSCLSEKLVDYYQRSNFVATVSVKKVTKTTDNNGFLTAEIEIIELFKGGSIKSIKIENYNLCTLDIYEGGVWLIFATKNENGVLYPSYCSGSLMINRKMNSEQYPNAELSYKKIVDRKIEVLRFFKKYKITEPNKYNLKLVYKNPCSDLPLDVNFTKNFSVYKLTLNKDLSVKKAKALQRFDSSNFSKKMKKCFLKNIVFENKLNSKINTKKNIVVYVVYYYYPSDGESEPFINDSDL